MICGGCQKTLQGGFRQDGGTYRCAKCVIEIVEHETNQWTVKKIVDLCNSILVPGIRPTKQAVREIRGFARALQERV